MFVTNCSVFISSELRNSYRNSTRLLDAHRYLVSAIATEFNEFKRQLTDKHVSWEHCEMFSARIAMQFYQFVSMMGDVNVSHLIERTHCCAFVEKGHMWIAVDVLPRTVNTYTFFNSCSIIRH